MGPGRSYIARGDIGSSLFVTQDGSDHGIVQSVADDVAVGVSYEGTRDAPVDGITPLAAKSGESCRVYTLGDPCEVIAGNTINAGDYLKPDADGKAIPAAAGEQYSAIADADCVADQRCKCTVQRGSRPV